ncbi:hypothetical protein VQ042_20920 [Aurantimonas sp. A2-1-M11]|uniref:helix-turn-helix transcriptional regulator n=1 Tax=Aurantimonas sp. A2-1-M11 TaxID=3113712 RepID=UPI002F95490A
MRELPVAAANAISGGGGCVFILRVERVDELDRVSKLKRSLGLTRTEAEIAIDMLKGLSAGEIAERRGNALLTIRTHIKSILFKSGTNRQAALVSLLCSRFGAARHPGEQP